MTSKSSPEPLFTKSFKLYSPHKAQKKVHSTLCKADPMFVVVCTGRQAGKTLLAQNQLIWWAVNNPRSILWFVAPTDSQAMKSYRSMVYALHPTGLISKHKGNPGNIEMQFSNGSLIQFKSAAAEDSLRGASVHFMIIDEAAFVKRKTVEEVLLPTLSVKGKKCLILSTPKGKNWFHDYYERGKSGDKSFKSFKFLSTDNPLANKEFIEMSRRMMPERVFAQEFLGEFVDGAACFENAINCVTYQLEDGKRFYAGVDIGLLNDSTVIVIMNEHSQVVHIEKLYRRPASEVKNIIQELFRKFKIARGLLETNGQGLPIYQDLKGRGVRVDPFTTTSESKSRIINQLIHAVAEGTIGIPQDEDLLDEMSTFVLTYSPTGKEKFAAESGSHDDHVMALALCYEAAKTGRNTGGNIFKLFIS